MKTTTFIFLLSLISSVSTTQELAGIYVFKASEEADNHYLVFDTQGGKSIALYYGSENVAVMVFIFTGLKCLI